MSQTDSEPVGNEPATTEPIADEPVTTEPATDMLAAADLQDNLLAAAHDLERLQTLLDDSHQTLQAGFFGLMNQLHAERAAGEPSAAAAEDASQHMAGVVKALQFQDMASQLIAHTTQRLQNCADRIAREAFAGDDDEAVVEEAPLRPNPVTQSEMDTGFVELF